jgi:hypothetical protein
VPESGIFGVGAGTLAYLMGAGLIAGLARGFSGFGAALIFVPLASAAIGPRLAAAVLMLIDTVLAVGLVPDAWRRADRAEVGIMTTGAMLGVPLGTLVLTLADPSAVRWAMCLLVGLLLALLVSGWRYRARPVLALTVGTGGLAGFLSGLAQIGGPPVVAYWLGSDRPHRVVRANIVLYFAFAGLLSAASYLASGLITRQALLLALTAGPLYGLGILLGTRWFERADAALFRRICLGLIGVAAIVGLPALDGWLR